MIEIIDNAEKSKIAISVGRYKKQGYKIIGVGYPFFHNENRSLINMCDVFVDDMSCSTAIPWMASYDIHDITALNQIEKFIVLVLSENRYAVMEKLCLYFPHSKIIKAYSESKELLKSLQDIEKSQLLNYRVKNTSIINIGDSIAVKGRCLIEQTTAVKLNIHSLELGPDSAINDSSRFENHIDALILRNSSNLYIGLDGTARIRNCYMGKNSKIHIYSGKLEMNDVYFGDNCVVHIYDKLIIGSGTLFAWNVNILDGDGHTFFYGETKNQPKGIEIGEKVWVGNNVIIVKGVNIGEGSIIGAGSVVTSSIPPHSLAVGNPAKVVRNDIEWKYDYHI